MTTIFVIIKETIIDTPAETPITNNIFSPPSRINQINLFLILKYFLQYGKIFS